MPEIQRSALGDRFGPSRIFTAAELVAEELQPVRWVVRGLLPEGVTLLAGKPKLGKSWLALGLGVAVASGGVALGTKPVDRGDVLYLALEDNPQRLQGAPREDVDGRSCARALAHRHGLAADGPGRRRTAGELARGQPARPARGGGLPQAGQAACQLH